MLGLTSCLCSLLDLMSGSFFCLTSGLIVITSTILDLTSGLSFSPSRLIFTFVPMLKLGDAINILLLYLIIFPIHRFISLGSNVYEFPKCTIKIFRGGGRGGGWGGGSSERCLKWGGGGWEGH